MSEAGSYDALVGVESAAAPGEILVVPGDADSSYLVAKLEGADGIVEDQMPPGSSLSADVIAGIRTWIDDGAQNN